jgi:hypothetical protein
MSNKVFKRNVTILRKIMQKHYPNATSEQINVFEFDIQNITMLRKKILTTKQLEHIFLYYIDPALPKGEKDD